MPNVSFRGTRDGLCISFGEGTWSNLFQDLRSQLERPGAPTFFKGARVTLDMANRRLGVLELEELIALLGKHNMVLSSVNGPSPEQSSAPSAAVASAAAPATPASAPAAVSAPSTPASMAPSSPAADSPEPPSSAPQSSESAPTPSAADSPLPPPSKSAGPQWPPVSLPPPEKLPPPEQMEPPAEPTDLSEFFGRDPAPLFIRRTLRSGQYVHHRGSIVVLGDVNAGAELIARGDIIVWGKLRGTVHAGADGDESALIGALIMTPTQLRIAEMVARSPDYRRPRVAPAEIAHIRNGQIIVEPWSA